MQKMIEWYLNFYPTSGVPPKRRIVIHLTYWIVWGLFSVLAFIAQNVEIKVLITCSAVIQGCIIYYGLTYFAVPNLFLKNRFVIGVFFLVIVYSLSYTTNVMAYSYAIKFNLFKPRTFMHGYAQEYIRKGILGLFDVKTFFIELYTILNTIALPFLIKFSRVISDYSMRVARLTKEKTDLEIDFLRTQLNPHFLLNSLNNIYSQVVSKDETAGDSIIVLSDLMKYILYHSGKAVIDLDKEVQFLRNYIDLEKLRGSKSLKIRFSQTGDMQGFRIAPLMLVNYVENAFKHGRVPNGEILLIDIDIKFIDETLYFRIENDFTERHRENHITKEGGIGIANTIKRLVLLYPNRHSLTIHDENNKFLVSLMIKLSPNE
ncbi:histidine kinase [Arcicella aurantiaca]|uniref:Histidine kinase n=1 Tax=Arcicella aurantiaca TaxID=591202 RepID=A0A316E198_9BACT|nr:sensor histidine kinase [Arcicella aurantiaca]PWK23885.1 histidine kinase [Arcicella aurantiaca]